MALKTFFTPKYKILIHGIVFIIAVIGVDSSKVYCLFNSEGTICTDPLRVILYVLAVYFLTFILFPLLFKNWKKQIVSAIVFLGVYSFLIGWLFAVYEGEINNFNDIFSKIPLGYLNLGLLFKAFITIIPIGILAFIYFLSISDLKSLKTSFFNKSIEKILNLVIAILLILYASIAPQGDTTDEVANVATFIAFFYISTFLITPLLFEKNKRGKFLIATIVWFLGICAMFFLINFFTATFRNYFVESFFEPLNLIRLLLILFAPTYLLSFIYGYIRFKIKNQDIN